ncbi:unnamed protein product [Adineta steineri]|uniref:Peptidase C14 caspase domain-containing protein n=1 Tax=Adineta steineri TaxID=433720 RepID=A0A818VXZ8_9BILA|nr:unnamed protein product [Adineta steineri]
MASSVGYKRKRGLVIGINQYPAGRSLQYCINDAIDLANTLQNIGFQITLGLDCNRNDFLDKANIFIKTIEPDDLVLFYFAGHGKQNEDENYLLLSDYNYDHRGHESDYIVTNGINVHYIMNEIKKKKCRTTIYLFDCCRSKIRTRGSDSKQGLSPVNAPDQTLVVFACAPGKTLLDETKNNKNGIFMQNVLKHISAPNKDIEEVMRKVADGVNQQRGGGSQWPYWSSSLMDKVYLATSNNQESPPYQNPELEQMISKIKNESSITFDDKKLTGDDMEIVAYYLLKDNTTLTKLNLYENQIGDKGAQYLGEALQNNKVLTILNFSSNRIGDKGAQYLGEALHNNKALTELELCENQIGDKGTQYLGEALKKNTALAKLNLSSNQIGDKGTQYLGEALHNNKTLTELFLCSNRIGDKGAQYLGEALQKNTTLTELAISDNQIGDEGLECVGEGLKKNSE